MSKWKNALQRHGPDGLRTRPHPRFRPELNWSQNRSLVALIKEGVVAAGYPNDLWTYRRVCDLIGRTFDV